LSIMLTGKEKTDSIMLKFVRRESQRDQS